MHRFRIALCVGGLAWAPLGCGPPAEKLVPVSGTVTLHGQPWTIGDVGFFPDPARGNPERRAAVGSLAADGTYRLFTAGRAGVPPGWYKAVVWATNDPAAAGNPWGPDGKLRPIKWLIDPRYTRPETTPLAVEVIDHPPPGHYDLRVTR